MESITANIFVQDIKETIAFYNTLGFKIINQNPEGDDPIWVLMTCGEAELMFQSFESLGTDLPQISRDKGGSLLLYVKMKGIEAFYQDVKHKVNTLTGLEKTFYDANEFSVIDNNGYVLTFAEFPE